MYPRYVGTFYAHNFTYLPTYVNNYLFYLKKFNQYATWKLLIVPCVKI
jgi:hypothetical protein